MQTKFRLHFSFGLYQSTRAMRHQAETMYAEFRSLDRFDHHLPGRDFSGLWRSGDGDRASDLSSLDDLAIERLDRRKRGAG